MSIATGVCWLIWHMKYIHFLHSYIVLCVGGSKWFSTTGVISSITVLYKSYRTVMQLFGQIQYSYLLNWSNTVHLGKCSTVMRRIYQGMLRKHSCKQHSVNCYLKPAKLILQIRSMARNRLYTHLVIVWLWCLFKYDLLPAWLITCAIL